MKKRVRGGTEAMSWTGENTAMTRVECNCSSSLATCHRLLLRAPPSDLNLSLTTMSDYDFRPSGSLNLKRSAGDGAVKKCAFVHP